MLGLIALGFLAAVISVITVHEGTMYALAQAGLTGRVAWDLQPIPPWGVPQIVSSLFWGGLWGVLFALLYDRLPGGRAWLKGLIYGLFVAATGSWILAPLIKAHLLGLPGQEVFGGLSPKRMLTTIVIVGGFGLGLGAIYDLLRPKPK